MSKINRFRNVEDALGGGVGRILHIRKGEIIDVIDKHNLVTNQGHGDIIEKYFLQQVSSPLYLMPFEGNYTATVNDVLATFVSNAVECVAYDEPTRVLYNCQRTGTMSSNAASKASFTFNDYKTIRGFALVSSSGKQATTGILFSVITFGNAKTVEPDDIFMIQYDYSLANSN